MKKLQQSKEILKDKAGVDILVDLDRSIFSRVDIMHLCIEGGCGAPLGFAAIIIQHDPDCRRIAQIPKSGWAAYIGIVEADHIITEIFADLAIGMDLGVQFRESHGHHAIDVPGNLP